MSKVTFFLKFLVLNMDGPNHDVAFPGSPNFSEMKITSKKRGKSWSMLGACRMKTQAPLSVIKVQKPFPNQLDDFAFTC